MQRLAKGVQRQRLHVVLNVRVGPLGAGARESAQLRRRHAHRAGAGPGVFQTDFGLAPKRIGHGVERHVAFAAGPDFVDRTDLQMVLQIGAHAGQVLFNFNAVLLEQRCRTDARELQDLRRADAAGAQQNFAAQPARVPRGQRLDALATAPDLNARAALAAIVLFFNDQAAHLRAGPHLEVGPAKAGRAQESFGRVPAKAFFLIHLEITHTFVVAGVEVVSRRNAGLLRRQREGVQNVPAQALLFHAPFAADFLGQALAAGVLAFVAVQSPEVFVDLALRCVKLVVVLVHAKAGQRAVPAPDIVAGEFGPALVVARLAAHVDHAVDAGRAAQRLAARVAQRAAVQAGF